MVFHVAGSAEAFTQGLDCLRKQGRFMEMSSWAGAASLDVNRHLLKEIQLRMVFRLRHVRRFPGRSRLIADGKLALAPQITARVPLDRAVKEGLGGLLEGREGLVKVLVKP